MLTLPNPTNQIQLDPLLEAQFLDYLTGAAADAALLNAEYFHALSEGYGFIMSLQFTNFDGSPYFTHTEVMEMIATLESGNGFWDRTSSELLDMASTIQIAAGL